MSGCCHPAINQIRGSVSYTFALAGNPNVGKSSIFNQLTGLGVVTANYPGKTVELNLGAAQVDGLQVGIVDLPGTYALGAVSEDQWVARQGLLDTRPDAVIVVVDASNLARNLYLVLQLLDLGLPVVVALNLIDEAEGKGIFTAADKLSDLLGVPVVPTVATRGEGLGDLVHRAMELARELRSSDGPARQIEPPRYGLDVERTIAWLGRKIESAGVGCLPYALTPRAIAVSLLEEDGELVGMLKTHPTGAQVIEDGLRAGHRLAALHGEPGPLRLARERHGLAASIADQVQSVRASGISPLAVFWHLTVKPATGIPLLFLVLAALFATMFYAGEAIARLFEAFWQGLVSPNLIAVAQFAFGDTIIARTLLWGFDAGLAAVLGVGIPYVLTFYLLLALIEDTGYLNSITFLLDQIMHRLGLHGRAIIPLVAGAGCNVPAIMGTRVLTTARERIIANALIVLVPCSARTAVILGAVSLYAGWQAALSVYVVIFALVNLTGIVLNFFLPGQSTGLVMEMFPFRPPNLRTTVLKTWFRFKDFLFVGAPIVFVGSLFLGALYETGWIWNLAAPLSPVVEGWLGLPSVAGLTLIFAVLRKELALQLLIALAIVRFGQDADTLLNFMSRQQIFVYAVVNTIYIPCVATMAVLARELKWRQAALITVFTVGLALLVGGLAWRVLQATGWLA